MASIDLPAEGGCLCGQVRFRLSAPPMITIACHCTGCQHMTASAFSLTAMMPESGFALIAGDPVLGALHRPDQHHHHCGHCLCWLYSTFEPGQGFINVRATALDHPPLLAPFVECMTAEKLAWVELPVQHSYPGWPPAEEFGPSMAAFATA